MTFFAEPSGLEDRPTWDAVPAALRHAMAKALRADIVGVTAARGGYSPSAAFVAQLSNGCSVFIKGAHPADSAHGTESLRQDCAAYRTVPFLRNIAPALLGVFDDGDEDGWMLAVFEYVEHVPVPPWENAQLSSALALLSSVHRCAGEGMNGGIPPMREKNHVKNFLTGAGGWCRLRDDARVRTRFLSLFADTAAGERWLDESLPRLIGHQTQAAALRTPEGVLHQDLRGDNFLFSPDGRVWLVDWPNACIGPVVMDVVSFIAAAVAEGAPADHAALLQTYCDMSGLDFSDAAVAASAAACAGYFANNAYRAIPVRLPRLRWMQKSILWSLLLWMAARGVVDPPPPFSGLLTR